VVTFEAPTCSRRALVNRGSVHEERTGCVAAGASDYIPKPVNAAELLKTISRWLPTAPEAHKQKS
jgi:CheY-like chemotaxis protein